jgi:uncharacterized protein involved in exopolysaccharide biosynthesis
MIANRQLKMEDYVAIARRHAWAIVVPALIGPLLGLLYSYSYSPLYTSYALLLVEPQTMPTGYVKPIVSERVRDRLITMKQNVLSRNRLEPLVNRLGLVRKGRTEDQAIDDIRFGVRIKEADPYAPPPSARSGPAPRRDYSSDPDVAGFYMEYTSDNPRETQQVCAEVTSMLLAENLEMRQQTAQSTTDFLQRQLEEAKQNLDEIDQKMSEFKKQHLGQLPSDQDNNLKILMGLTAQLEASSQNISRAQQDKAYVESQLEKETAALKAYEETPILPSLRQRVLALQNALIDMKTRYTEDYPDIAKTEREIEQLKNKIKEMNDDPDVDDPPEPLRAKLEAPQIRSLKAQIRQIDLAVERTNEHQKVLQKQIDSYQARLAVSPELEEQWKQLTRDNETAHTMYNNLLYNENTAKMQTEMERKQQGEQVRLIEPATLPMAPSFPDRKKFVATGFAAGFGIGLCFAFWRELQDKKIRDERDVLAALELPMLAAVPTLPIAANGHYRSRVARQLMPLGGGTDNPEL